MNTECMTDTKLTRIDTGNEDNLITHKQIHSHNFKN